MAAKMKISDRARQFLPFDSLRGFYALVKLQEKEIMPKKELSDDELERLDLLFKEVKKSSMIKVKYYYLDGYIEQTGLVAELDTIYRTITIVTTKINLDDIIEVEIIK